MALGENPGGVFAAKRFLLVTAAIAALSLLGCESASDKQAAASAQLPPAPTDYTRIGTSKETVEERLNRLERDLAEIRIQYSGVKPELDKTVARNAALEQRLATVEQAFGPVTASISNTQRTQSTVETPGPIPAAPLSITPHVASRPTPRPVAAATISQPAASYTNSVSGGAWGSHLASFREMQNAKRGWRELQNANGDLLAGHKAIAQHFSMPGKGEFQRVVVGPVASRNQAASLCNALKQRGTPCNVLKLDATAALPLD